MIVILGETHDDILYFTSVLANKREDKLLGRYKIAIGTIFNQEALIAYNLYTSTLTSAVLMHIIERYPVDLVIAVGRCIAVSKEVKSGNILVSKKVIDVNVDLTMFENIAMAQVPGFNRDFEVQDDIIGYICQGLDKRISVDYHRTVFLSTDNMSASMRKHLIENRSLFAMDNDIIAIDQNSAGVAIASQLKETPYIIVKVAENNMDAENNLKTYSDVLSRYIDLGKAVVSTINDIGRGDILEGV